MRGRTQVVKWSFCAVCINSDEYRSIACGEVLRVFGEM